MNTTLVKDASFPKTEPAVAKRELLDHLEAAKLSGIPVQLELAHAEIAAWHTQQEGFVECCPFQLSKQLAGAYDYVRYRIRDRPPHADWRLSVRRFLDRHSKDGGGVTCSFFAKTQSTSLIRKLLRLREEDKLLASITIAPIEKLIMPIPTGVLLRLSELKRDGRFSHFLAVAPSRCFVSPIHQDPIILGVIVTGHSARYFEIARW